MNAPKSSLPKEVCVLPDRERISRLLAQLYDAAANRELWEVFLRDFSSTLRASAAAVLMHDSRENQNSVVQQFGFDPSDLRKYYDQSRESSDIWTARARPLSQTGWTGVSEQLCEPGELRMSDFYNGCLRHLDIFHGLFGVIQQGPQSIANIGFYRPATDTTFGPAQREILNFFMPHLDRAFQLHCQLATLRDRNQSLQSAVNTFPNAIFVFNANGDISFLNHAANDLLSAHDGLTCKYSQLRGERSQDSVALDRVIRDAIASNKRRDTFGGVALIRRKTGRPLKVVVMPVRSLHLGAHIGALGFVIDPSRRQRPRNEILAGLFGLTVAECRLALLLTDGKSLTEISQELGVSRNTLKTQTASLYAKTGTLRQSQLVRLISQIPHSSGEGNNAIKPW